MQKIIQMYESKTKRVYTTADPKRCIISYKDDVGSLGLFRKGSILGKGEINNQVSNHLMKMLEQHGIPTHFIDELNSHDTLVKYVKKIPLEVIVRNIAAGSLSKRLGISEGIKLTRPVLEFLYKNDTLDNPLINDYHILALNLATANEIELIKAYSFKINRLLTAYFNDRDITLVDFKIEFGKTPDDVVILTDEISPDTCSLWDKITGTKLDNERFRRDLAEVEEVYADIYRRVLD